MSKEIPEHVGIIPDGNRRCAKRLLKQPWKGHEWGIGKIKKVFEWSKELGIRNLTFYTLSLENLEKRPEMEKELLFSLAENELRDVLENKDNFINRNRVRMFFFGRLDLLPEGLQELIKRCSKKTRPHSNYTLNLAIAYGGRQEIIDASKSIGHLVAGGKLKPEDIDELVIRQNLQTNGAKDPDLVIRTGGEKRLSNFLLFQSAYSELAFTDTFWPELAKKEFFRIIRDFSGRDRRFGK